MFAMRMQLDGRVETKNGQQFVSGRGLAGDRWTRILRLESHGLASEPVAGGQGIVFSPNGIPEEAYFLGGEKPSLRPSGLPAGAKAIYDAGGNIIKLVGTGIDIAADGNTVTITCATLVLNCNVQLNGNLTATGSVVDGDGDGGA